MQNNQAAGFEETFSILSTRWDIDAITKDTPNEN